MATVDQLDIRISATATEAIKSINQLCGCLDSLQKKLNMDISHFGLGKINAEVRNITNSLQTINSIKKVNFSGISSKVSKISKIDGKKISETANSIRTLTSAANELNSTNFNNKNITSLLNATTRLAKIDVDEKKFERLGSSLKAMVNNLAGAKEVSRTTSSIVNSIARLANSGSKANETAKALPFLKTNLNSLMTTLSKAPAITNGANELFSSISRLASAGNRTKQTADNLDYLSIKLKNFIQSLKNAPAISSSTIKLVSSVASLANAGKGAGNMFSSVMSPINKFGSATKSILKTIGSGLGNAFKAAGSGVYSFTTRLKQHIPLINSASRSTDTLIGKLGRLYIAYHSLRRIGRIFSRFVTSASDYIEEFNYFNVSISKIAEESQEDYKKYGYASAQEYADSFKKRLTELTTKMSGFKIGENGELFTSAKIKNLGLDVTEITNFESRIAQMTNSVGMIGEASIAASKGLTMLSGDLSSLANVPLQQVMNNLSSGLAGASTAVKKYGIDISVATLNEQAMSLGIEKSISKMTQAEKEYLRVITMINQSKTAWTDLINTINQPANQFRMLQNSLKQISTLIGNLFMPVIQKVMAYINAMANAVKDLIQWISDLFGLKWENTAQAAPDTSEFDSSYDDLVSDATDAADAIDDAADAQKKFNKQLQSFDELNNLTTTKSKDKDKDKDDDKNADVSGVLSNALIKAVEDYEKQWNKAFKNMQNDVEELTKKIEGLFSRAWETGDGSEIGGVLAEWLNKGIEWVNGHTEQFSAGLDKIASILGTGLNGAVEKFNFPGLGTAVGNSVKAALEAQEIFFDTVDWTNLGSSLATSLNTAIETGVLQQYFKTMASKIKAAIEAAFGAVTTFNFKGLGSAIGQGVNDFLDKMNEIDPKTKLNGWQMLGKTISDGISGILDTITTALDTVEWWKVGQAIADFIANMDIGKIGWNLGKLVNSMVQAFYTLVSKRKTWRMLGRKISDGINNFFKGMNKINPITRLNGWQALGKSISDTILGFGDMIITALDSVRWQEVGQAIADFITSIDWGGVIWKLGEVVNSFAEALKEILSGAGVPEPLADLIVSVGITGWIITKIAKTALGTAIAGKIGTLNLAGIALTISAFATTVTGTGEVKTAIASALEAGIGTFALTRNVKVSLLVAGITTAVNAGVGVGNWLAEKFIKHFFGETKPDGSKWELEDISLAQGIKMLLDPKFNENKETTLERIRERLDSLGLEWALPVADIVFMSPKKAVEDLGKSLKSIIKKIPDKIVSLALKIGTTVEKFAKKVKNFIGKLPEKAISLVMKIGEKSGDFAEELGGFIADLPSKTIKLAVKIGTKATELGVKLVEFINEIPSKAVLLAVSISTTVTEIITQITDLVNKIPGEVLKVALVATLTSTDTVKRFFKGLFGDGDEEEGTVKVKYDADTTALDEADKQAETGHKNITVYNTEEENLDNAIAKAKKGNSNTTDFKTKTKTLDETIEKATDNHNNTTKFDADPTDKFNKAVGKYLNIKLEKISVVKFKVKGALSELNSIIDNILIPNEKKFKITLDVATKGMGSAAVNNLPWNKHAKGSTGLPKDEIGVVNDQAGSTYKELIIPPHGEPFIPEGRNVMLAMQKGTRVIPAEKTRKFLKSLPHFANGTEDFGSGNSIADGIRQAIEDTVMPYIKEIVRALNNGGGTAVASSGKKTTTKYADTVKEIQKAWTDLAKWFEKTVAEPIEKTFEDMKLKLLEVFKGTNDEMSKEYEGYSKEWQETLNEIPGWISENIGDAVTENFDTFCSDIKGRLETLWSDMQSVLSPIPEWVEGSITSPFNDAFTSVFDNVTSRNNTMWDYISRYAIGKLDYVQGVMEGVFTRFSYLVEEFEKKLDVVERDISYAGSSIDNINNRLNETKNQIEDARNSLNEVNNQNENLKSELVKSSGNGNITSGTIYSYDSKNIQQASHQTSLVLNNTAEALQDSVDRIKNAFSNVTSSIRVKRYATGGFPEDGWFRASHGEMIGQFDNGQSVVANNQQITSGIAIAVQEANQEGNILARQEIALLQRQNDLLMGILEKETGITQKEIFNAVRSENSVFRKRTGRSAFEF